MKRLSLCLALICLLVSGIWAVERSSPKAGTWRLLSSEYHQSSPDEETWESSNYYYAQDDPLQLDSLVTLDSSVHYFYSDHPGYTQKESLFYNLPGYIPADRTLETFRPDGLLWNLERFDTHAPDSPVSQRIEYSYDQQGNLIEELRYSDDSGILAPILLINYSYRSDNQLIRKARYRVINSSLENLELETSEFRMYNASGLETEFYYWYSFGYWGRISSSYNDDSLLCTETIYSSSDSLCWTPDVEIRTDYILSSGVLKPHHVYRYSYSSSLSDWVWAWTNTHSYSDNGLQEIVNSTYPNPDELRTRTIVYNSGRHVVSEHCTLTDGDYASYSTLTNVWDLSSALDDPYLPKLDLKLSAYPNPFNPRTTIHYELQSPGKVVLDLYNIRGQRVKRLVDTVQEPGAQTVELLLNSSELGSGVYFLRLEAGGSTESTKILLLK